MTLLVDIKKRLGRFRLDVSFQAEGGQVTGLLGASGCGKSVTLKCIAGIQTPDEGQIVLDGRVLFDSAKGIDLPPQRRRVGYLFQSYALFPHMTAAQNIAVGVRDRAERAQTVERLIRSFRLEGCEGKYPHQLSGGQQQRTALARIVASQPEALLLDEPFSALDSHLKRQVEPELTGLFSRFPGPVLFVTHDRDEVKRLCQRVCVLDGGTSQPAVPVRDLFEAPRTLSACLLSGCGNISRAKTLTDGRMEAADWGAVLSPERPLPPGVSHVAIRPHLLRPADGPGPGRIACLVERTEEEPFSTRLTLSTPGPAPLVMELSRADWLPLAGKQELWVELPPEALLPLTEH